MTLLLRVRDYLIVQDTAVQAPDGSARMGEPSSKACSHKCVARRLRAIIPAVDAVSPLAAWREGGRDEEFTPFILSQNHIKKLLSSSNVSLLLELAAPPTDRHALLILFFAS